MPRKQRSDKRFFLNGNLHRIIHKNRPANIITAYDFVEMKIKVYPMSEVMKNKQNAFSLREAASILGRHVNRIKLIIFQHKAVPIPQREHSLDKKTPGSYFLSEDDMMRLRDYLSTVHRGRPRKDGRVVARDVPTREELRSMVQSGRVLYVKENDEFVPVWKAKEW